MFQVVLLSMIALKRHPFAAIFRSTCGPASATTFIGMKLTFGYLFKKPVTMLYPEERPVVPEGYRGIHGFDEAKCHVCGGCAKACPVDCISIESIGKGKDQLLTRFTDRLQQMPVLRVMHRPLPHRRDPHDPRLTIWRPAAPARGACLRCRGPRAPRRSPRIDAMLAAKEAEKKAKAEADEEGCAKAAADGGGKT